jgi:Arc/MetJ family transcription regulator
LLVKGLAGESLRQSGLVNRLSQGLHIATENPERMDKVIDLDDHLVADVAKALGTSTSTSTSTKKEAVDTPLRELHRRHAPALRMGAVDDHAWQVQEILTQRGQHRSAGAADLVVAATAELQRLTLLHPDRDFESIAAVTGQALQWCGPNAWK